MKKKHSAFDWINGAFLLFLALAVLIPFYFTIVKAFTSANDWAMYGGRLLFPPKPTLGNFEDVLRTGQIGRAYFNSAIYVVAGVAYNMFLTVTLAYGLSKRQFPGRALVQNLIVFSMFFSGGLIPFFMVVKGLNLIGTRASVIIPFGLNLFNMIVMRTFFEQIPKDLEESASIDGANMPLIFWKIHLPLVKPALATLVLFIAVERWNEWFYSSLFLGDNAKWPIQLTLRQILQATGTFIHNVPAEANRRVFSEGIKAASVLLTMLPIMCIYPFLQKYFVKGVMIGAIKS